MSKRIFTSEQIEELSKNPYVTRCSEKSVTYAKDFKILAVRQYLEMGASPSQIFQDAGFDRAILGQNVPDQRLHCWRKLYESKGDAGLVETRGKGSGRPRTKGVTEADRIKWLEAENAYLKAENAFLAKLRKAAGIH